MISGNNGDGIDVESGVANTLIQGNYIGVDQTGAKPLGNGGDGLSIDAAPGITIGGTVQGAGNVISANALAGLLIEGGGQSGGPGRRQLDRHRQLRPRPRSATERSASC